MRSLLAKGLGHQIDVYSKKHFGVTEKEQAFYDWFPLPRRVLSAGRRYRDDMLLKNAWNPGETWEDFNRRMLAEFEELPVAEKLVIFL